MAAVALVEKLLKCKNALCFEVRSLRKKKIEKNGCCCLS
jgi:hypothetical protein